MRMVSAVELIRLQNVTVVLGDAEGSLSKWFYGLSVVYTGTISRRFLIGRPITGRLAMSRPRLFNGQPRCRRDAAQRQSKSGNICHRRRCPMSDKTRGLRPCDRTLRGYLIKTTRCDFLTAARMGLDLRLLRRGRRPRDKTFNETL